MVERTPRLVGEARQAMAAELAGRYHDGASTRSLARESGRSYGLVQKLLREAGVEFRPRGGADPASPETKGRLATVGVVERPGSLWARTPRFPAATAVQPSSPWLAKALPVQYSARSGTGRAWSSDPKALPSRSRP